MRAATSCSSNLPLGGPRSRVLTGCPRALPLWRDIKWMSCGVWGKAVGLSSTGNKTETCVLVKVERSPVSEHLGWGGAAQLQSAVPDPRPTPNGGCLGQPLSQALCGMTSVSEAAFGTPC